MIRRRRVQNRLIRADINFEEALRKIRLERIKRGRDKEIRSNTRLTRAMTKSRFFQPLKDDLINSEFTEDETD